MKIPTKKLFHWIPQFTHGVTWGGYGDGTWRQYIILEKITIGKSKEMLNWVINSKGNQKSKIVERSNNWSS